MRSPLSFVALLLLPATASAQVDWSGPTIVGDHSSGIVGTGDFNADGVIDIAYSRNSAFHWYEGPEFNGTRHEIGAGSGNSYGGTCADMNGDGWPDLVASNGAAGSGPGLLWVFLHPGDPVLAASQPWERVTIYSIDVWHQNDLAVADLDGDGRLDIVVRTRADDRRLVVALQNADFTDWTTRAWPTGETSNGPEGLSVGDLDSDGDPEIVLSGVFWDAPQGWRTGGPVEHLIDPAFVGLAVKSVVADLDGDGQADDVVMSKAEGGGADGSLSWYRHTGSPMGGAQAWTQVTLQSGVTDMHTLAVADFDEDGHADILAGRSFGRSGLFIYYGSPGAGPFVEQVISAGDQSYVASVADLDADGDLDFAGPFKWQGRVQLWRNGLAGSDPDVTPPTTPGDLEITGITYGAADLSWSASIDETTLAGYRVYVDGALASQVAAAATATTVGALVPQTVHSVSLTAFDAAGNESSPTEPVLVVTPPAPDFGEQLVAHWRLDEADGQAASDETGLFDGVLIGGPAWAPADGQRDGALRFFGGGDRVELGAFDSGADSNGLTVAAWVRVESFSGAGDEARFISKATGTSEGNHVFMLGNYGDGTSLRGRLRVGSSSTVTLESAASTLALDQWAHVAMTYDGARVRLYRDGVEVASTEATGSVPRAARTPAALGNQPVSAGDRGLIGYLDDAVVFDVALSPSDLAALAAGTLFEGGSPMTTTCICTSPHCGNPSASAGCVNATGAGASLTATGTTSVAADDLVLTVSSLPAGTFGLLFMGSAQVLPVPIGAGQRCIGGQLIRWPIQNSGAAGEMSYGPGLAAQSSSLPAAAQLLSGSTFHIQAWYRDVQGAPGATCTAGLNVSNAGTVTFTD